MALMNQWFNDMYNNWPHESDRALATLGDFSRPFDLLEHIGYRDLEGVSSFDRGTVAATMPGFNTTIRLAGKD